MKLRLLVLMMSVAIHALPGAHAASSREETVALAAKETQVLRTCAPVSACPVFFISLFGGKFPLPTRYELVSQPGSAALTFTSSASEIASDGQVRPYLAGIIGVDKVENLRTSESNGTIRLTLLRKVGELGLYKVDTPSMPSLSKGYGGQGMLLLKDDKHFLQVSDQNPELMEILIAMHRKLQSPAK